MIPKEVFAETLMQFFAPIRPYLDDPGVSDIMINGPNQIYVEKKGLPEQRSLACGPAQRRAVRWQDY
jgi:type IV secretory pathway ATPase VirB11/archaellum biosynthesis ATPase